MGPIRTGKIDQGDKAEPSMSIQCRSKALAPKKRRLRGSKYMAVRTCFEWYKYGDFPQLK